MRKLAIAIVVCGCSLFGQSKMLPEKLTPVNPAIIESALTAQTSGNFKVTFNITVKSTLPVGAVISCGFSAQVQDGYPTALYGLYQDSSAAQATGSGTTRTCILNLFYSWPLVAAATDTVTLAYTVQVGSGTSFPRQLWGNVNGTFSLTGPHTLTIPVTL